MWVSGVKISSGRSRAKSILFYDLGIWSFGISKSLAISFSNLLEN